MEVHWLAVCPASLSINHRSVSCQKLSSSRRLSSPTAAGQRSSRQTGRHGLGRPRARRPVPLLALACRTHEAADQVLKTYNGQIIPGTDQVCGAGRGARGKPAAPAHTRLAVPGAARLDSARRRTERAARLGQPQRGVRAGAGAAKLVRGAMRSHLVRPWKLNTHALPHLQLLVPSHPPTCPPPFPHTSRCSG